MTGTSAIRVRAKVSAGVQAMEGISVVRRWEMGREAAGGVAVWLFGSRQMIHVKGIRTTPTCEQGLSSTLTLTLALTLTLSLTRTPILVLPLTLT